MIVYIIISNLLALLSLIGEYISSVLFQNRKASHLKILLVLLAAQDTKINASL